MAASKMGRPTDSPKDVTVRARVDAETLVKLDKCVMLEKSNRSEIIRRGIEKVYDDIKK